MPGYLLSDGDSGADNNFGAKGRPTRGENSALFVVRLPIRCRVGVLLGVMMRLVDCFRIGDNPRVVVADPGTVPDGRRRLGDTRPLLWFPVFVFWGDDEVRLLARRGEDRGREVELLA